MGYQHSVLRQTGSFESKTSPKTYKKILRRSYGQGIKARKEGWFLAYCSIYPKFNYF